MRQFGLLLDVNRGFSEVSGARPLVSDWRYRGHHGRQIHNRHTFQEPVTLKTL